MSMTWEHILSVRRFAPSGLQYDIRSQFQRDYDRIIFSSPFRRLQNKTQVFPLPGSVFVHNRLTHSLEVASVGRSLARMVARKLLEGPEQGNELLNEMDSVVAAACLAHDLGNPPFGHSGEKAISSYFTEGNGQDLKEKVSEHQWADLLAFEGNANAFRVLTHRFAGRRQGGFSLTFATLAALVKYPYPSVPIGRKKYGMFSSEMETYKTITQECGIPCLDPDTNMFARSPLVYLMEAADDISYLIMDIEDAHKLGILSTDETEGMLMEFLLASDQPELLERKESVYNEVTDTNERIAYLRATVINLLVHEVSNIFIRYYHEIMQGSFASALISKLDGPLKKALDTCRKESVRRIYNHPEVVKIELTGYNVLGWLMNEFSEAVLNPDTAYNSKLLSLMPVQFRPESNDTFARIQSVLDFVSGMTDLYAVQLYKDLRGIAG